MEVEVESESRKNDFSATLIKTSATVETKTLTSMEKLLNLSVAPIAMVRQTSGINAVLVGEIQFGR